MTGDGDRDGPGDAAREDEQDDRPELDIDAAFAALVAEFSRPTEGVGRWPAAEDLGDDDDIDDDTDDADQEPAPGPDASPAEVARFRASRRGPRHRLPDGSDLPDDLADDLADDPDEPLAAGRAGSRQGGTDPLDPLDRHDRFVPPEAPPITSTDLVSRLAWLGVLGGPLLLLAAALVSHTLPTLVVLAALGGFIGGFVTLVARLPRDRDDGGDDGAVV